MSFNEWAVVRLEDLCSKVTSGGTPNTQKQEYYSGNVPWLKTQEITFNRIYKTETFITEEGLNNSSAKWIPENSVIVAMYGATAGRIAINKIPLTTNQACCNIILNPSQANYNFIYYHLLSRYEEIAGMAIGGAQPNLNAGVIKDLRIQIPPIETQNKIAEILTTIDDKIENNLATNQTLEEIARTLFKEWFVNFNYPNADGSLKQTEFGEIPENWNVGTLGDIYKTTSGGTPSRNRSEYYENGDIGWVKSKELNNSFIIDTEEKITTEALKNSSAKLLPKHSVLIAIAGATIGEIGITTQEFACNQNACAFLPNDNYPFTFIYHYLRQSKYDIKSRAVGSAQPYISQQALLRFRLIIPPTELVREYHRIIFPLFQKIQDNIQENESLKELRDSLLPKLMSGEIIVNPSTTQ
ncbi:restriction endonuclease subunit S [Flavobacterium sp. MAH-1]|nr:restriction endonuclease subunit S [Flavobacterium agri]NUY82355.1 restriction endonuclease subunit S [Flavobacterium agri]